MQIHGAVLHHLMPVGYACNEVLQTPTKLQSESIYRATGAQECHVLVSSMSYGPVTVLSVVEVKCVICKGVKEKKS
jgi:hypothetical protein